MVQGNEFRKGKNKTGTSSEKPKQPQRGLGVAQLEKLRLHGQLPTSGFLPTPHFPTQSPFQYHINEEMRIQGEYQTPAAFAYPSPSPFAFGHPVNNYVMGTGDPIHPYPAPRWNPNTNMMIRVPGIQPCMQQQPSMITRHLLGHVEQESRRNTLTGSTSSSSRNLEVADIEELDLELKL